MNNKKGVNLDLSWNNKRGGDEKKKREYTQGTSGTQTLSINFTARYVLSKRVKISAFFEHQVITPMVSKGGIRSQTVNKAYRATSILRVSIWGFGEKLVILYGV